MRKILAAFRRRPFNDLMIACFPKSGSTYLSKVLQAITGFPEGYLAEFGQQNEQDIVRRKLQRLWRRSVLQQHVKGTRTNIEYMTAFGIRPIVHTRSLYDVVVSLYDHYDFDNNSLPCGYVSSDYWQMTFAERIDYLIAVHLPWYFNFYTSWRDAAEQIEILPLTYESLFADPLGRLSDILDFYGIASNTVDIEAAITATASANTRLNVGVSGRGLEKLSKRHQQTILRQADACRLELNETGSLITGLLPGSRCFTPSRVVVPFTMRRGLNPIAAAPLSRIRRMGRCVRAT